MKVTYNSFGQITAEKWYDANNALAAHYKYVYDGAGNIVRSIDMIAEKEYNYTYESGRIVRATESDITISGYIVTSKTIVNSILYTYDNEGRLTRKGYVPAIGSQINYYYEYPENSNTPVVKIYQSGAPVQSHSKTDSFGRKVFDELQTGSGFVSRQFSYHAGEETAEHADNGKLKSTPTTMLVSQIVLSDGRTLSYEYDAEERITKVTDSLEGVTEYTYDTQGQLTSETKNGVTVNITYDNYGNIRTKGSHTYSYDHDNWKDLLTKYDAQSPTYDAQGNPTTYLGHALTWSKSRQLDTYDNNTYTYNASGIRTSKTVCGEKHTYALDGVKIVRETWGSNTLSPLYDNEEGICGIAYNEVPYYFIKNLQGDVIAIVNRDGDTVARYSYDAWGKCSITLDNSGVGIATINPYRYRSYYYDNDTGLYYLQSRYYDPEIGTFINADEPSLLGIDGEIISHNLFTYCNNNVVNCADLSGMFSLNDIFKLIANILEKLKQRFLDYLDSLIVSGNNSIKISTTVISIFIDSAIALLVSWWLSHTIKQLLKTLLNSLIKQNSNMVTEIAQNTIKFFLNNFFGKLFIKGIAAIMVSKSGLKQSKINTLVSDFTSNILVGSNKLASRAYSLVSAFSSIGGIFALVFDLMDREWDDYITIKV